jgi:type II restriction/modification system DNA methylase subunit YeeA
MLDLWHEARVFAGEHGLPTFVKNEVHPRQLFGLETNIYAQELASVVVWIGYLQWLNQNGIGWPVEPILRKLDNIQQRDAILTHDAKGSPVEPEWPQVDFIIGNPPFLGDKKMRGELGDKYVVDLRGVFADRIPGGSDLVCYWFEKAREAVATGAAKRVGLLATQGIRGGANREVLDRIKESGDIFWAESDRDWVLDGTNVHVSMVGFDDGSETRRELDGDRVDEIYSDLSSNVDLTDVGKLSENEGIAFIGTQKGGKFDISRDIAEEMLGKPANVNGRPNSDVVRPWANASIVTKRLDTRWIIDFGPNRTEGEAAMYEAPFEYLVRVVKGKRLENSERDNSNIRWWLFQRPRPEMYAACAGLGRYIATPRHSKHRLFLWLDAAIIPDSALVVFARSDDYCLGVLHSRLHEVWTRRKGTQVREAESGFRYTPETCFMTFPMPWVPNQEPTESPQYLLIASLARELAEKRDAWLNPPDATEAELKKRTLTNLYNARPAWLAEAHRKLDEAVFAAYGWPASLTDAEILER